MSTDFVPAYELVTDKQAQPLSWKTTALVLHGVLGSGQNFRGLARTLVRRRPDLALVLVDLRHHGQSSGAPPPQTLQACALDLVALQRHLRKEHPELPDVQVLMGHSFGGKVALWASRLPELRLTQVFVLDSNPGALKPDKDYEVLRVIRAVRQVPQPIESRAAVVDNLLAQGLSSGLANWMTTNLRRTDSGYEWVFNLDAIEELLVDYFQQDLWEYLAEPRQVPEFQLIVAENSDRFSGTLRARAQALPPTSQCHYHVIPNAGHWLHVDNPGALLDLLESTVR